MFNTSYFIAREIPKCSFRKSRSTKPVSGGDCLIYGFLLLLWQHTNRDKKFFSDCSGITKLNGRILVTSSCDDLDVLIKWEKSNKYKKEGRVFSYIDITDLFTDYFLQTF